MLVLSRRLNEKLVLPGLGVTVEVVAVEGGRVRIGIKAPPQVKVVREELLEQPEPRDCSAPTQRPRCTGPPDGRAEEGELSFPPDA